MKMNFILKDSDKAIATNNFNDIDYLKNQTYHLNTLKDLIELQKILNNQIDYLKNKEKEEKEAKVKFETTKNDLRHNLAEAATGYITFILGQTKEFTKEEKANMFNTIYDTLMDIENTHSTLDFIKYYTKENGDK